MRNFKSQNILCVEAELRDLKSKLLYGSGTAKLQVVLNLLYGSGLHNYQATVFSLCGSRIVPFQSSKSHYSVCGSRTAEL